MACFWQQNLVRLPERAVPHVRHFEEMFSDISFLYPQNPMKAMALGGT
jgi:hypothetical protein